MEAKTISLVQESFEKVKPIAASAAKIFYSKLFEINPEVKILFPSNEDAMVEQEGKLMMMLTSAVSGLSHFDDLTPILKNLGKRHATYNVKVYHYDAVGSALIYTLAVGLGNDFTSEVREAWIETYDKMSAIMIGASCNN